MCRTPFKNERHAPPRADEWQKNGRRMARNKRDIDRQLKRDTIEDVACGLFMAQGYEATSMAGVAAAAGVAPNTLYWYFANKDELLIAVLDRMVGRVFEALAGMQHKPLSARLLWLLKAFDQASGLVTTVHARVEQSDAVRDWHERFHRALDALLVEQLTAQGMDAQQAATMATVGTYVMEGLMSHPHSARERETVVRWLTSLGLPA